MHLRSGCDDGEVCAEWSRRLSSGRYDDSDFSSFLSVTVGQPRDFDELRPDRRRAESSAFFRLNGFAHIRRNPVASRLLFESVGVATSVTPRYKPVASTRLVQSATAVA